MPTPRTKSKSKVNKGKVSKAKVNLAFTFDFKVQTVLWILYAYPQYRRALFTPVHSLVQVNQGEMIASYRAMLKAVFNDYSKDIPNSSTVGNWLREVAAPKQASELYDARQDCWDWRTAGTAGVDVASEDVGEGEFDDEEDDLYMDDDDDLYIDEEGEV